MEKENDFLNFLSDSFEHTYWIPGNHEYYRSDIKERTGWFHEKIRSNVSLLNNTAIEHKGVRLLFSTLWSKINPALEFVIQKSMADFRLIKNNGKKITVDDYDQLHEGCRAFLVKELSKLTSQKTIVVTHHLPTFFNYPEKYRYSELKTAFATELFDLIDPSNVDYWIYGHSHEVVPDFRIAKTILTTNQLGYVEYGEHLNFQPSKILGTIEEFTFIVGFNPVPTFYGNRPFSASCKISPDLRHENYFNNFDSSNCQFFSQWPKRLLFNSLERSLQK